MSLEQINYIILIWVQTCFCTVQKEVQHAEYEQNKICRGKNNLHNVSRLYALSTGTYSKSRFISLNK